jgi:predicted  nucleic acid-binding Zn-ribbon protein
MNLNFQDILTILGPILTLMGFMWHHFNKKFDKMDENMASLRADIKADIKDVEEKLSMDIKDVKVDIKRVEDKVDAVKDRVSRIEGQLVPAKVISFEEARHHQGSSTRASHSKVAKAQ